MSVARKAFSSDHPPKKLTSSGGAAVPRLSHTCSSENFSDSLHLETLGASAATGTLELPALALDERLLVGVGTETEVLDRLAGVLGATDEDDVGASRGAEGELVEGEALTAGLEDAGAGGGGEAQGADAELGALDEAGVIGDLGDGGHDLALELLVGGGPLVQKSDLGQGNGGPSGRLVLFRPRLKTLNLGEDELAC